MYAKLLHDNEWLPKKALWGHCGMGGEAVEYPAKFRCHVFMHMSCCAVCVLHAATSCTCVCAQAIHKLNVRNHISPSDRAPSQSPSPSPSQSHSPSSGYSSSPVSGSALTSFIVQHLRLLQCSPGWPRLAPIATRTKDPGC